MKDTLRTSIFVGVALVSAAIAWFVSAGSTPAEAEAFAKVGTGFYPEFTDPTEAGSLEIISYDSTTGRTRKFTVELDRGRWRIPSHHGYPADAEDRLEKAAASLIGITRQALAGRRPNAHERFGVLQPPDSTMPDPEPLDGVGQRIMLKDKQGNVLVDYILGKRVAETDNLYFVRIPSEEETYRAEVDLDVSTRFGDWVEKDLLKLSRDDLLSMEYSSIEQLRQVETADGQSLVVPVKSTVRVHRDEAGFSSQWQMDGLNSETEEIDTSGLGTVQTALDSLELNGVRPKLQGLTADLAVDESLFPKDQDPNRYFSRLQRELVSNGFYLTLPIEEKATDRFALFGRGGEFTAKTSEGLVYHMHFGHEFLGTQQDIEVGKTEVADEEGQAVIDPDEAADKPQTTRNRYLFIRVEFEESLLGEAPKKPEEPKKPEGLKDTEPKENESKEAKSQEDKKEKTPEELKQEQLKRDYESKMTVYRSELAAYEEDNKEYRKKLKDGQAKADQLNNRFREWYYVIPQASYENLTFARADVVKEKEAPKPSQTPRAEDSGLSELENLIKGQNSGTDEPAKEGKPAVAEKPQVEAQPAKAEDTPKPEE